MCVARSAQSFSATACCNLPGMPGDFQGMPGNLQGMPCELAGMPYDFQGMPWSSQILPWNLQILLWNSPILPCNLQGMPYCDRGPRRGEAEPAVFTAGKHTLLAHGETARGCRGSATPGTIMKEPTAQYVRTRLERAQDRDIYFRADPAVRAVFAACCGNREDGRGIAKVAVLNRRVTAGRRALSMALHRPLFCE